jgi:hypothetical protein
MQATQDGTEITIKVESFGELIYLLGNSPKQDENRNK